MVKRYEIFMKDGTSDHAECKWTDMLTLESMLDDSKKFIRIGDKVFAKDFIARIHKVEPINTQDTTEE